MIQTEKPLKSTLAKYGYLQALPSTYGMYDKFPFILFLHGFGEIGNGSTDLYKLLNTGLPRLIQTGKCSELDQFIILSIQSPTKSISYQGINAFVDYALNSYRIDSSRMYITGLSGGAIALENYLKFYDRFAAAVSIAGNTSTKDLMLIPKTPIWLFHDDGDPTVKDSGSLNLYKTLKERNPEAEAKITIYHSSSHDAWDRTYDLTGVNQGLTIFNFGTTYKPDMRPLDQYDQSIYSWMLMHSK